MTTWMQVMALVRELDDKRRRREELTKDDAERLVAMLLDFHMGTVEALPNKNGTAERTRRD